MSQNSLVPRLCLGTHCPRGSASLLTAVVKTTSALAVALACIILPGCSESSDKDSNRTLRVAYRSDFKSMDPSICNDTETATVMRLLYQGLLDCDDNQKLIPWLADAMPTLTEEGHVYTFRLRKGVRFANGREVTAQDFLYAIERTLDPSTISPWGSFLRGIRGAAAFAEARKDGNDPQKKIHVAGLTAPDPSTLRIELEQPDLSFLWMLALPFTYAVPQEEVEKWGDDFYRHPCGTGPCVLANWQRGLKLRFEKNPYFDQANPPGFDAFEVLLGYDDLTTTMMFERGQIDILLGLPLASYLRLTRDPHWKPYTDELMLNETLFLIMNTEMPPFTDRRVRQAVCYAINQDRLLRTLNNRGKIARGLLPAGMPGSDPARKGYPYDPAKAKELLAEAGFPKGFETEFWYSNEGTRYPKIAEVVQQDLKEVGITLNLRPSAFGVCIDALGKRKYAPFSVLGWMQDYPDPSDFLKALCDGAGIVDDGCNNSAFYDNKTVNKLIADAGIETNPEHRFELYHQAETIVLYDAPYCVLIHYLETKMCQPWVKNFKLHPLWILCYDKMSLERP